MNPANPTNRDIKLFSGSSHEAFTGEICSALGFAMADRKIFRFSDGEIGVSIQESVRGTSTKIGRASCRERV